ncbi:MAG: hypothetical protein NZM35_10640, partial [Chitinophagales bacterium]|nr:hypothetical protein [Chitinophagales bacterium]
MKWKNSNGTFEWELRFGYAFASFPFKSNKKKILCLREQHHFIHPFWDTTLFIRSFRKLVHLPKRQHAEQVMELRSQL